MDIIDLLQVKIFEKLTDHGYNVMDVPELNTPFPFVKMGDVTYEAEKNNLGKIYGYNISHVLNVWTEQGEKQISNHMVRHISDLLLEINLEDYEIIDINTAINYTDYEDARQAIITLSIMADKRKEDE